MIKKNYLFFSIILFLFSCKTTSIEKDTINFSNSDKKNLSKNFCIIQKSKDINSINFSWNDLTSYAKIATLYFENEKSICHLLKIDLHHDSIIITSPNDITSSQSAQNFSKENNCDIVINTTPFTQKIKYLSKKNILGIYQINDTIISKPNQKYCALEFYTEELSQKNPTIAPNSSFITNTITKNNSQSIPCKKLFAKIHQFQLDSSINNQIIPPSNKKTLYIHGGFWQILKNGNIIQFKDIKDSRTAVGISKDERFFYILIVEGEKKSKSIGLSYEECALILKNIGAFNAMEFDGGSSTCLIINHKNYLTYNKNPNLPLFLGFKLYSNEKE